MPFVDRQDGNIVSTFNRRQRAGQEFLPADDPDILAFRNRDAGAKPLSAEDLYDMLESKGVVTDQDRPRPKMVR